MGHKTHPRQHRLHCLRSISHHITAPPWGTTRIHTGKSTMKFTTCWGWNETFQGKKSISLNSWKLRKGWERQAQAKDVEERGRTWCVFIVGYRKHRQGKNIVGVHTGPYKTSKTPLRVRPKFLGLSLKHYRLKGEGQKLANKFVWKTLWNLGPI